MPSIHDPRAVALHPLRTEAGLTALEVGLLSSRTRATVLNITRLVAKDTRGTVVALLLNALTSAASVKASLPLIEAAGVGVRVCPRG
jgi:hypothetical protein